MLIQDRIDKLETVLKNLIDYTERNTCSHEETERQGFNWEVCTMCGAKWADDEGGRPEFVEPKEITEAYETLNG